MIVKDHERHGHYKIANNPKNSESYREALRYAERQPDRDRRPLVHTLDVERISRGRFRIRKEDEEVSEDNAFQSLHRAIEDNEDLRRRLNQYEEGANK